MTRRLSTMLLIIGGLLALPGVATVAAADKIVIRLATLAPKDSTWDKVFRAWNTTLEKETGGEIGFHFFNGGVSGDEKDVLRKLKLKQLDAGGFTTVGLSSIARPLGLLTTPGVIDGYEHLNKVRNVLAADLEAVFDREGYKLLGWGDAGFGRVMSKSRPILMPQDYKVVRPWVPRGEAVFPEFMKIIGANGVEAGITEVFADLQTGSVDTVMVSAIAAVALQWFSKMNYVAKEAQVPIVGATLIRKDFFDTLEGVSPEKKKEYATKLAESGKKAHEVLLKKIEKEDEAAYKAILAKGLKEFSMGETPAQKKAWADTGIELRKRLTGKLWDRAFYEKMMAAAGKKPEF